MGGGYGQRLANVSALNEPHGHLDFGGSQQGAEPSCPCLRFVRLHRLVLIGIVWRGPKIEAERHYRAKAARRPTGWREYSEVCTTIGWRAALQPW